MKRVVMMVFGLCLLASHSHGSDYTQGIIEEEKNSWNRGCVVNNGAGAEKNVEPLIPSSNTPTNVVPLPGTPDCIVSEMQSAPEQPASGQPMQKYGYWYISAAKLQQSELNGAEKTSEGSDWEEGTSKEDDKMQYQEMRLRLHLQEPIQELPPQKKIRSQILPLNMYYPCLCIGVQKKLLSELLSKVSSKVSSKVPSEVVRSAPRPPAIRLLAPRQLVFDMAKVKSPASSGVLQPSAALGAIIKEGGPGDWVLVSAENESLATSKEGEPEDWDFVDHSDSK
jgi:hypothetical protein